MCSRASGVAGRGARASGVAGSGVAWGGVAGSGVVGSGVVGSGSIATTWHAASLFFKATFGDPADQYRAGS